MFGGELVFTVPVEQALSCRGGHVFTLDCRYRISEAQPAVCLMGLGWSCDTYRLSVVPQTVCMQARCAVIVCT